jgi:hypothetical protein
VIACDPEEAWALLRKLDAPPALIRHSELVMEAADQLLDRLAFLGVSVTAEAVRYGVVIHDIGKILHPNEISGGGSKHEEAGQALLLKHGVPRTLARICVTHARWNEDGIFSHFEDLLVALADRLWKGRREAQLEERIISCSAARLAGDVWDLFVPLDTLFEAIAAGGHERLERSRL